jgi:hypothetical protein
MSLVDIFNRALSACGSEVGVSDPGENSREAALCRLWYPQVRDNVLGSAPWACAKREARLARISERVPGAWAAGQPRAGFAYAYAAPSDILQPLNLWSYARFDYGPVGATRALSCDEPAPILSYLYRAEDSALWEPELARAVTHTLATMICLPLTGSAQRLQQNAELAFGIVQEAKAQAANSSHMPEEALPVWITDRGYGNPTSARFYYPLQTLSIGGLS